MAGEIRDDLEHVEPYGYTSEPHVDAETFSLFFDGDRSHGVVFCVADRRYRMKPLKAEEVAIYDDLGQFDMQMTESQQNDPTDRHFTAETNAEGRTYIKAYKMRWDKVAKKPKRVAGAMSVGLWRTTPSQCLRNFL